MGGHGKGGESKLRAEVSTVGKEEVDEKTTETGLM